MNTPRMNPNINPDDPKWTAYVLEELDGEERAEIEQLLATSDEARALVEELTVATASLKDEMAAHTPLMMSPEQRAAIRSAVEPAPRRWFEVFPSKWGLGLAAAAVVALTVWIARAPAPPSAPTQVAANLSESPQGQLTSRDRSSEEKSQTVDRTDASNTTTAEVRQMREAYSENERAQASGQLGQAVQKLSKAEVGQGQGQGQGVSDQPPVGNNVLDLIRALENKAAANDETITFAGVRSNEESVAVRDGIQVQDNRNPRGTTTIINSDVLNEIPLVQSSLSPGTPQQAAQGGARGGGGRGGGAAVGPGRVQGISGGPAPLSVGAPPPPPPAPVPPRPTPPPVFPVDRNFLPVPNTEAYDRIVDNPFIRTTQESLATFSIDVDTASYANVRRFLNQNQLPPRDAVRIEELINYFNYDYAQPSGSAPIAPNMEVAAAPWNPSHRLVRIGIKAREVNANRRPPSNLVFLIDVSGSMNSPEKLPLVKSGLHMLVERLGENDMVSIVVYAGASGLVLPPTSGIRKAAIRQAIDNLQPGGSTNGASGIQLAYNQATANFIRGGANRVILMTDGDFNVGITNQGDLIRLIEDKAKSGVFLNVLGFGMGNVKDSTLEKLADNGNGSYAYIDNITEARKVLVEEMSGTLVTIAKDVKIQVDFNPARVEAYRLIGYENRVLRTEDFNNDLKDAGDMGAGHTVTALFEVVPKGGEIPGPSVDPSKYTQPQPAAEAPRNVGSSSNEMLTLRVRYKQPTSDTSSRMDVPLEDRNAAFNRATPDFRFAAAVAEFGMILRNSPYRGNSRMDSVLDIAEGSRGSDRNGYRLEFISLVEKARNLGR